MQNNNDNEPHNSVLKPATIPVKCPNCRGYGHYGFNNVLCQSCEGKGVIFVPIKEEAKHE